MLQFFSLGVIYYLSCWTDYTDLATFRHLYRSVPTHDDIMVPETLLKKRKSQEKAREEKSAELQKRKKVWYCWNFCYLVGCYTMVMIYTILATRLSSQCCRLVNHLSGLKSSSFLSLNFLLRKTRMPLTTVVKQ